MSSEPVKEQPANALSRHWFATRPPFLSISVVACLVGIASAYADRAAVNIPLALVTIFGAVLIHAGVNVLNDYYDSLIGTDEHNSGRIYPFTGGSRFIQNGIFTERHTARFGVALLLAGATIGAALALVRGPGLWLVGGVGMVIGWGYSSASLRLNSRGLGELSVALGFGLLIPVGADYVQRGAFSLAPLWVGASYGLLVMNILFVAQFPDRVADEQAGKRHWVVRLGPRRASLGYLASTVLAYGLIAALVVTERLPASLLAAFAAMPLSLVASVQLLLYRETPQRLAPAIAMSIAAALGFGLLVSVAWVA